MGSEIGIKGYVVRGKNRQGNPMVCATEDGVGVRRVPDGVDPVFSSLDVANKARGAMVRRGWSFDVSIFRVHADGREEKLPSYEEALAALDAVRAEVERALDSKAGGSVVDGAPLLWTVPRSALTELLRIAKGGS